MGFALYSRQASPKSKQWETDQKESVHASAHQHVQKAVWFSCQHLRGDVSTMLTLTTPFSPVWTHLYSYSFLCFASLHKPQLSGGVTIPKLSSFWRVFCLFFYFLFFILFYFIFFCNLFGPIMFLCLVLFDVKARRSNLRHRPIGIGVQVCFRFGLYY